MQIGDIIITKDGQVLGFISKIGNKYVYFYNNIIYTDKNNVYKILRKTNGIWEEIIYEQQI